MSKRKYAGLMVTLDGSDGVGKSTMVPTVEKWFMDADRETILVREPGGTKLGEGLRALIMQCHGDGTFHGTTDVLMFVAAKHALYHQVIVPALTRGAVVITDRWTDSLYAYQGAAMGVDTKVIDQILHATNMDIYPDLTLLLDVPVEVGRERIARKTDRNSLDTKPDEFYEKVRAEFLKRAKHNPQAVIINASRSIENVQSMITLALDAHLSKKRFLAA